LPSHGKRKKNATVQRLRRRFVYGLCRAVQGFLLVISRRPAVRLGAFLGVLCYYLIPRQRRPTLAHLAMAFGDRMSDAQRRAIARRVFANAGRGMAEMVHLPRWTDDWLRATVAFDNPEPIRQALRSGRGAVILTGHFGNWELLGGYAARILQLPAGVMARRLSNPYIDEFVQGYRRRMGLAVFLRGDPPRGFFRHLVGGGVLAILADQDIRRLDGIFIDFLGRPAHTPTGPAELIIRARVPWFLAMLVRQDDGCSHRLLLEGPFEPPDGADYADRVRRLTEDYSRRIEAVIRRHPDQWMWMHNRWRKQPRPQSQPALKAGVEKNDALESAPQSDPV